MAYWLYNMGMPMQVSSNHLLNKRKVQPLDQLVKTRDVDEKVIHDDHSNRANALASAYQQSSNNKRNAVFNVEQIMSAPVKTLNANMAITEAWQLFSQHHFRHFVVTNQKNNIVGIVSDRDMLRAMATIPQKITKSPSKLRSKQRSTTVAHCMTNPVLTTSIKTSIREVCQVMFNHHIGALPVMDDQGVLVGIVTRSNILSAMTKESPFELWI